MRVLVLTDTLDGPVSFLCEADALVRMRDGKALEVTKAPAQFVLAEDEPIFRSTGESFVESTFVAGPVHRDADGRLMVGWRNCEERPLSQDEPLSHEHALP